LGSGSHGVAAMETNRRFIGFEIEKKYYDIAVERIASHSQRNRPTELTQT